MSSAAELDREAHAHITHEKALTKIARLERDFEEGASTAVLDRLRGAVASLKSLTPAGPLQRPSVVHFPGLTGQPFWSSSAYARETALLEQEFPKIKSEFDAVRGDPGWTRNSAESGSWSVFYLYNRGDRVEENCRKCPATTALLDGAFYSYMKLNKFGNVFFSLLEPGTKVPAHSGPCNFRIRCNLGLSVADKTSVTVGGETRGFKSGSCIYFDDSFVNSASNLSSAGQHAVLLIDVWHPELTALEMDGLNLIFTAASIKM